MGWDGVGKQQLSDWLRCGQVRVSETNRLHTRADYKLAKSCADRRSSSPSSSSTPGPSAGQGVAQASRACRARTLQLHVTRRLIGCLIR